MGDKRQVRCWMCGNTAEREPSTDGVEPLLDESGNVRVVGREETVEPYGMCDGKTSWGSVCGQPMLLPEDAKMVLEAAVDYDRRGGNTRSEFDCG